MVRVGRGPYFAVCMLQTLDSKGARDGATQGKREMGGGLEGFSVIRMNDCQELPPGLIILSPGTVPGPLGVQSLEHTDCEIWSSAHPDHAAHLPVPRVITYTDCPGSINTSSMFRLIIRYLSHHQFERCFEQFCRVVPRRFLGTCKRNSAKMLAHLNQVTRIPPCPPFSGREARLKFHFFSWSTFMLSWPNNATLREIRTRAATNLTHHPHLVDTVYHASGDPASSGHSLWSKIATNTTLVRKWNCPCWIWRSCIVSPRPRSSTQKSPSCEEKPSRPPPISLLPCVMASNEGVENRPFPYLTVDADLLSNLRQSAAEGLFHSFDLLVGKDAREAGIKFEVLLGVYTNAIQYVRFLETALAVSCVNTEFKDLSRMTDGKIQFRISVPTIAHGDGRRPSKQRTFIVVKNCHKHHISTEMELSMLDLEILHSIPETPVEYAE